MEEDDARLKPLIDQARDLAKRRGYPAALHFLDLAAAELEKGQPAADSKNRKSFSFERYWNWSWPRAGGRDDEH